MDNLVLTRVDDRLIHGQIITAWIKAYPARQIIIVDDEVAKDEFLFNIYKNAAPKGIRVYAKTIDETIAFLMEGLFKKTMLVTKSPINLVPFADVGLNLENFIIGGMGCTNDRTAFYKNVFASQEELDAIRYLMENGWEASIHITPDRPAVDLKDILK